MGFGALLAALGGGCSSSTAGADDGPVSQAQFAERFASVWCESVAPCCASRQIAVDSAACQAQARDYASAMLATRVTGDTRYGPAAASACLERLQRALERCELEDASSACSLIFVGPQDDGTPCANGSDCASGYCALGEASLSGVCAAQIYESPRHGTRGEPCVGSCGVPGSFQCPTSLLPSSEGTTTYCYAQDGLYCSFDSDALDALSCQPYADVGAPCEGANVRCRPGSFCSAGSCLAQQAAGSCADTPELCDAHSYCDATRQCRPKRADGAACRSGEECLSSSCDADADADADGICNSGNALLPRACSGAP